MPIWEYKIISLLSGTDQESTLNALGKDRWELVSLHAKNGDPVAYLKRESIVTNGGAMIEEIQGSLPAESLTSSGIGSHRTLKVPADIDPSVGGWLDTELEIGEEAAGISVSISGEIITSSGEIVGPEGAEQGVTLNPAIGLELPIGCLVAKVGDEGTIEPVYYSGFLATEDKGRLFLTVNDKSYDSNQGDFIITVTVL